MANEGLKIVVPKIALAGTQVPVEVTVTNLDTTKQYCAIVGRYDDIELPLDKSGETLAPDESTTFTTSFTMPKADVKITILKYHYVKEKEGWDFDETAEVNVALVITPGIPPTYANIPELIRKVDISSLNPTERAQVWWELQKATWKVFAKPSIEPYEDDKALGAWLEAAIEEKIAREKKGKEG